MAAGVTTVLGGMPAPARAQELHPTFTAELTSTSSRIALQADGRVLIAGLVTLGNGVVLHSLVRLDTNGSLDASFELQMPGQLLAGVFQNQIVVRPDGRIVFSGMFVDFPNPPKVGMFQFQTNGAPDPSFSAPIDDGIVTSLALQPDGRVIVAGSFNRVGAVKTFPALVP